MKFNLISFQKSPVPLESRSKADAERIYHFLITSVLLSQGEGWDLFIYALIHSALSDSRATYGLFWTLLAARQKYCNNLCPLVCNNCLPFAPPSNTWIYKLQVTFQLVLFSPQGSSQPWLRLTRVYKHTDAQHTRWDSVIALHLFLQLKHCWWSKKTVFSLHYYLYYYSKRTDFLMLLREVSYAH